MLLFSLSRLNHVSPEVMRKSSPPGDWFWYRQTWYQRGSTKVTSAATPFFELIMFNLPLPHRRDAAPSRDRPP